MGGDCSGKSPKKSSTALARKHNASVGNDDKGNSLTKSSDVDIHFSESSMSEYVRKTFACVVGGDEGEGVLNFIRIPEKYAGILNTSLKGKYY